MNDRLQTAREYAARGWAVFPCKAGTKEPDKDQVPNGHLEATTNAERITRWWTNRPNANIGIACGPSGLVVVDVDVKEGADGRESWEALCQELGNSLRDTVIALTPSGGEHYYYSANELQIGPSTSKLGPGLDVRAGSSYVVAPPSRLNGGGQYSWYPGAAPSDRDPAPLPGALADRLGTLKRDTPPVPGTERVSLDDVAKAAEALQMLSKERCNEYQPWVEVGMSLRSLGEVGLALWDQWSRGSAKYQPGVCGAKWATFTAEGRGLGSLIQWANEDAGTLAKGGWMGFEALRGAYGDVTMVWPGWIVEGHVTMIAGPQNVGKTWMSAFLMAVLSGRENHWPDGSVYKGRTGPVVMVETESMLGVILERAARWGVREGDMYAPTRDENAFYTARLPNDVDLIEKCARQVGASAIIMDSLSGGHELDENSAEMRRLLQSLSGLAKGLQIPVIVMHHSRKRGALEPARLSLDRVRGSGTITQFCRSVWGMWRPGPEGGKGPIRVQQMKWSFGPSPEDWGFEIVGDGELHFGKAPQGDAPPASQTEQVAAYLKELLAGGPRRGAEIVEAAMNQFGVSRATVYRAADSLYINQSRGLWRMPEPSEITLWNE